MIGALFLRRQTAKPGELVTPHQLLSTSVNDVQSLLQTRTRHGEQPSPYSHDGKFFLFAVCLLLVSANPRVRARKTS